MRSIVFASISVFAALFASVASAQPALCRDDRGEPVPCVAALEPAAPTTVVVVPVAATSDDAPNDDAPNVASSEHAHRAHEVAYFDYGVTIEAVDLRQLHFTPATPSSVPAMARDAFATGVGTSFENVLGGLTLAVGFRPVSWLRLPEFRLSAGVGDLDGARVDLQGGEQPLTATFHELYYLRAELGGGIDLDFDPVRFYALAHVAIAGYFASATVEHATIGDLGTDTFAEDAWELGWTVGLEVELEPWVSYSLSYRHVHTGVESNAFFFGVDFRIPE